jgi:hypothetical protein
MRDTTLFSLQDVANASDSCVTQLSYISIEVMTIFADKQSTNPVFCW